MEMLKTKSHSKAKALLVFIGLSAAVLLLTSTIFHLDPFNTFDSIVDFATHHYFMMGFISLTIMVLCLKIYQTIDLAFDNHYTKQILIGSTRLNKKKKLMQYVLERTYYRAQKRKSDSIDKEKIKELKFSEQDVLENTEEVSERKNELQKAMMLGNAIKHKVKIFFKDQQSYKHVETTVWHADSKYISLKGGITLPVRSIYKVEI